MLRAIWKWIPKTPLIGIVIVGTSFLSISAVASHHEASHGACAHAGPADFLDRSFRVLWCGKPVGFLFASEARNGTSTLSWPLLYQNPKPDPTRPITVE